MTFAGNRTLRSCRHKSISASETTCSFAGIKPWTSGEFQLGFQYIANLQQQSRATHGGWGVTVQFVQKVLGGDNKLAFQYGRGGGTGFGTLARFYYPDFSLCNDPS